MKGRALWLRRKEISCRGNYCNFGRKREKEGSLTSAEIAETLHEETELTSEQLDDMYEIFQKMGIDIEEVDEEEKEPSESDTDDSLDDADTDDEEENSDVREAKRYGLM